MNIFYTSANPDIAALHLDDKRLNKMQVETAQLLCSAAIINGAPPTRVPYKLAYKNHPCTLWAAKTNNNFNWLQCYLRALNHEWWKRGFNAHATSAIELNQFVGYFEVGYFTSPPKLVADKARGFDCGHIENIHEAYQLYLNCKWNTDSRAPKWTNRNPPAFYILSTRKE
jgi:hypothetical protein